MNTTQIYPDKVSRASLNAQQILENPLFQAIWRQMAVEYFEQWKTAEKKEERELLWIKCQVMDGIKAALETTLAGMTNDSGDR